MSPLGLHRKPNLTIGATAVLLLFLHTPAPSVEPTEAAAEAAGRHLRMLRELADYGMELARKLSEAETLSDNIAMQFARVAKAIRMIVALEARLLAVLPAKTLRDPVARTADNEDADREETEVERQESFGERREYENLEEDLGDRPTEEIIAEICLNLGLSAPSWQDVTTDNVAGLRPRPAPTGMADRYANPPTIPLAYKGQGNQHRLVRAPP